MKTPRPKVVHVFLDDHELDIENLPTEETVTMPNAPDIILTHLHLEAYRGIELMDIDLPPRGVIFSGSKGKGKTSALESIPAILKGIGIGPEAIHLDRDKCKLSLDFVKASQHMTAKRTITAEKTTVELLNADGTTVPRAKEQFRAIFGDRGLDDPLKLFQMDAKDRRKAILEAIPSKVTPEDLTKWTGIEQAWNCEGHGHEVLARVRQMFFDQRTTAGQERERAKAAAQIKGLAAVQLRVESPEAMTPDAARTHVAAAERELAVLNDRRMQARKRDEDAAGTRAKVAELRSKAEALMAMPEAVAPTAQEIDDSDNEFNAAKEALEAARLRMDVAQKASHATGSRLATAQRLEREATTAITQANELEAAIAPDENMPLLALATGAAETALEDAKALVVRAEATAKWAAAKAEVTTAETAHKAADAEWDRLDKIVTRLTKDAPAELATRADAIPGLEITPMAILYQRKSIDMLSDGEKLEFAVEIVKRLTTGAKVLIVDGIEVLPPELQPAFVRKCLEGGWALFGTRVADGELQIIDVYEFAKAA
jgi:hypothetical protein